MNQLKLPDLYTFHLLKLYYKLYRNKLPLYFENFIPQYGAYHQNLRNNHIRLPAIRCEFEKNNSKYQMHFRLHIIRIFLLMHYCPYKYYIGFVTLSSTDKQSNLEMSSLLILPIYTLWMYTRVTPVSLP